MKKITNAIMKIIKKETSIVPLGRWNIDYCNKKINNKVDLSNEDHCGPCGQYVIQKNDITLQTVRYCENKQIVK